MEMEQLTDDGYVIIPKKNWKKKHWWNPGLKFFDRRKLKVKPLLSFIIIMRMPNQTQKQFVIATTDLTFKYQGFQYRINPDLSYYDVTEKQNCLIYDYQFSEPLNKEIEKKGDKAFFSVTPANVKPIIDMQQVKILSLAAEIDKYLKLSLVLGAIAVIGLLVLGYMMSSVNADMETLKQMILELYNVR